MPRLPLARPLIMRVTMAMVREVLRPKTTVVTALLISPDSRIGLRPNLSTRVHNRIPALKNLPQPHLSLAIPQIKLPGNCARKKQEAIKPA